MQTILEDMRSGISEEGIRLGGEILKQGGLVAFPTETVYDSVATHWMRRLPQKFMQQREDRQTIH